MLNGMIFEIIKFNSEWMNFTIGMIIAYPENWIFYEWLMRLCTIRLKLNLGLYIGLFCDCLQLRFDHVVIWVANENNSQLE